MSDGVSSLMEFQGVEDSITFIQLFQVRGRKAGFFVEPQGNMGQRTGGFRELCFFFFKIL